MFPVQSEAFWQGGALPAPNQDPSPRLRARPASHPALHLPLHPIWPPPPPMTLQIKIALCNDCCLQHKQIKHESCWTMHDCLPAIETSPGTSKASMAAASCTYAVWSGSGRRAAERSCPGGRFDCGMPSLARKGSAVPLTARNCSCQASRGHNLHICQHSLHVM
jgi:hypothetical protein